MGTRLVCGLAALGLLSGAAVVSGSWQPEKKAGQPTAAPKAGDSYVLNYSMKRIDGTEESLEKYKGKVVVLVNVASKCGFTSQYEGLEKLYESKKDQGLVILGFPANNFRDQEPGTNEEVAQFCKSKFGVTFPMFEKISVKGADQHPLYKQLETLPPPIGGSPPKWNFTKFVVDRTGHVVGRYDAERPNAGTANLESGLLEKVDELLGQKEAPKK